MPPKMNRLFSLAGRITYTPPPWMSAINGFRKQHPMLFCLLTLVLVAAGVGAGYLMTRPGPLQVVADVSPPDPPADVKRPLPDPLVVRFDYFVGDRQMDRPVPEGNPSVARLDLIGKPLDGIGLTPSMPGRWQWTDDRTLTFVPEAPWPAGTLFTVNFPAAIFSPETRLKRDAADFTTPAFEASMEDLAFYQDPTDSSIRRVVGTLFFSHPVDEQSLKQHLSLTMRPSGEGMDTPPMAVDATITVDERHRRAYVSSAPLDLPPQPNTMRLTVNQGVTSSSGGNPTQASLSDTVLIPDRASFLKVSTAEATIVTNDRQEPEQIINLGFTDAIADQELLAKLSVYLLPPINHHRNSETWESPREVTDEELAASERISLKAVPNPRPASTAYHFVIDVPENRYLYLRIDSNLTSVNGYVQMPFFDTVLATPSYPRQVRLAGEGSLIAASGKRQIGIMARGLTALRTTVGRLLPGQITHLITQSDGDIRTPYFSNPDFSEADLADITREILTLSPTHAGKANYTTLDLSAYHDQDKRDGGLFFVSVEGWNRHYHQPFSEAFDRRLILITDLGLLVKNNADDSHELFVQSIQSGRPVAGATVALLGRNGLPLFRRTTDDQGHASIPVTRDFREEKAPSVYLVTTDTDTAFIPFAGHSRQVDTSRFDVGGVQGRRSRDGELNAYLFSDRGIYRPGETIHLGAIVKNTPLDNISGIPLEVVVQGPRHNTVKTEKTILPEKGFFQIDYATDATADTGRYQVSLYLVRDNRYRDRLLGSTAFTVEEFVPDTMRIKSMLADVPDRGWTTTSPMVARVTLNNLFGAAAQNRRVQARIRIRPARFQFQQWADYRFTDPLAEADKTPLHIDEALEPAFTDADGRVQFTIPLDRFREGAYGFDFFVEGFDPGGGRSVSAHNQAMISPLPHLVGFKSDGDLQFIHAGGGRQVDWIAIAPDLSPLTLSDLIVKHLEIQHLSTLVKQPNGTYKYQTVDRERAFSSRSFAIEQGGTAMDLPTGQPGDFAVEIHGPDGLRLARLTYTVVGQGNLTGTLEKEANLQLRLDRTDYRAGETVQLGISAPYAGAGLITIESDRVHAFKWFQTATLNTLETIRLPNDLEGNAYVSVAFVRDAGSPEIFTSPLSLAIAPITIDRSRRRLDLELTLDEKVRPGQTLTIGYRTRRPSRIVVFAVDEGILQVAGYRTPDPLGFFLQKRALGVTTLQMLDLILPEFERMREIMASGGGAMQKALAANLNPFARQTDTPAVFWSGIVDAGPDERTVSFTVPDAFAGNLKIMAVAVGEDTVGTATAQTRVRGPFVLSPSLLLQAAPGDEFTAFVGVANMVKGSGPKAAVEVSVTPSANLFIVGDHTSRLTIDEGGEAQAAFTVKAGETPGAARLIFTARLGEEEGRRTAGLSIRPAMAYRTTLTSGYVKDGSVELSPIRHLYPDLSEQHASASANPLILIKGLTAYLKHFPHGCTEQVVSQVFPLVGLAAHPVYASDRPDIERHFAVLINRLRQRQLPDGGFSFWPGGSTAADFPSVYVMHFLIESRELGLAVPPPMIAHGAAFLRQLAGREIETLADAGVRAQAIYLLTRLGETTTNALVHLQETLDARHKDAWRSDLCAVYMAATYRLLHMDDDARRLVGNYRLGQGRDDGMDDFNWPLSRDAQVVFLLSRHFKQQANRLGGGELLRLVDPIFNGQTNTIGASYTILALGTYGRLHPSLDTKESVNFSLETADGGKQDLKSRTAPFPMAAYTGEGQTLTIDGKGPLFYQSVQSGFDRRLPTQPERSGLEIHRDFVDAAGGVLQSFAQGQDVTVRLRIRSLDKATVTNVAIVDLLPGGFEVIRSSVPRRVQGWQADYVDVREDRVIFYGSVQRAVRELTYRVKVTAPGHFTVPPAVAVSMYDRSLHAATAASSLTVAPAP